MIRTVITLRFYPARQYAETVFADGTNVPAVPQDTDEYRARARQLGYGQDTAAMSREHEALHTLTALRASLPYSPTLWAVAHGAHFVHSDIEEAHVLATQAYMNGAGPRPDYEAYRRSMGVLARQAEAFTRIPTSNNPRRGR